MTKSSKTLEQLRKICLALPEAVEEETWGHPNFRVAMKIFSDYHGRSGEEAIAFKVGKQLMGVYLADERFYQTPYIGRHGWVSLKAYQGDINWSEVADLVRISYRNIAPARLCKLVPAP